MIAYPLQLELCSVRKSGRATVAVDKGNRVMSVWRADRWILSDADSALPASINGVSEKAGETLRRYLCSFYSNSWTSTHKLVERMLQSTMFL